jgi:pSer/pThr/pTyr-binding forkhead associated (FHA) protein
MHSPHAFATNSHDDDQQSGGGDTPAAESGGRLVEAHGGRAHPIPDLGLTLGRDPACDVVVEGAEVSRRHAVIKRTLFGYSVSDTSTNGTYVNGRRVEGAQVLGPDDELRVGEARFRFEADPGTFERAADLLRAFPPAPRPASGAEDECEADPAVTLVPDESAVRQES